MAEFVFMCTFSEVDNYAWFPIFSMPEFANSGILFFLFYTPYSVFYTAKLLFDVIC
jgi:hypothetical protein